jgi:GT2 family glycosyltransferase
MPRISVIVVSWNGRAMLGPCLDSLAAQTAATDAEVLVVDNGSTDGTVRWLRQRHPNVRVLALDENLGFAAANDRAAAEARGEWLVLLNNDAVAEPTLCEALIARAEAAGAEAAAARIRDWSGDGIEFGGGAIQIAGYGFQRSSWHPGFVEAQDGAPLPFACAAAMAVRRERFLELGGFDPAYFAYAEDVDFGWRLNLAGGTLVYAAGAAVRHRRHATSSRLDDRWRHFHWYRNTLLTLVKNADAASFGPRLAAGLALLFSRVASFHREAEQARQRGDDADAARWLAIAAGASAGLDAVLADWGPVLERRAAVQALRRVSDAELAVRFGGFPVDFGPDAARWPQNALAARLFALMEGPLPLLPGQLDTATRGRLEVADRAALAADNARLAAELAALQGSWSWRLTAPLRRLLDSFSR